MPGPAWREATREGAIGCNNDIVKYELGKKKKKRKSGACRWLRQLVKCDATWCLMAVVIMVSTFTSPSASAIDHREILRMTSKLFMWPLAEVRQLAGMLLGTYSSVTLML
jgi:hypothetical protein